MKCDETKPQCKICLANEVECPGYVTELRWSHKHEVFSRPPKRQRGTATATTRERTPVLDQRTNDVSPPQLSMPDSTSPSIAWDTGSSLVPDILDLPNLEACGYEALAFSSTLPVPYLTSGSDLNFTYPFFGEPNVNDSQLEEGGDESTAGDTEQESAQQSISGRFASTDMEQIHAGSATLLQTFYRLSLPSKVPGFSDQDLINHYFEHVCAIYSCFDSASNPFRFLVNNAWSNSATVYFTIQSMAVGHLANHYPYMAPLGIAKRSQAWKSLQQDLQKLRLGNGSINSVLLSLMLLGLSSAWHQASNLGLQYLFIARNIMQAQLQSRRNRLYGEAVRNDEFFHHALMYWEMLATFVDPVPIMPFPGLKSPKPSPPTRKTPTLPHPWTGVATEVQFALAEIGRILRRQRDLVPALDLNRRAIKEEDEKWAKTLEDFLYGTEIPEIDDIVDYDDPKTRKADLVSAAEAYRCIGLLELYRAFPELLRNRLDEDSMPDSLRFAGPQNHQGYADELDSWITAIAIHVLDTIKPISLSSCACRLLPILLVASAGQLRFPEGTTLDSERHDAVVEARYLVEDRMLVLSRKYPQRPLLQMVDIVKEVWQRLDGGSDTVHWLDVAHEKGWQTIMG